MGGLATAALSAAALLLSPAPSAHGFVSPRGTTVTNAPVGRVRTSDRRSDGNNHRRSRCTFGGVTCGTVGPLLVAAPDAAPVDYNAVPVAKSGSAGVKSASEMMSARGASMSLGAPPPRPPRGGKFVTTGGVSIDAAVRPLRYTHGGVDECAVTDDEGCDVYVSSFFEDGGGTTEGGLEWGSDGAIERLVELLDHRRGALLTSSYEFPGR